MKHDDKSELLNLHVKLLARVDRLIDRVDVLEGIVKRMERRGR